MLGQLTPNTDERLMVGSVTGDDAAVWRLDDERALIVTADFITPLVDDARTWGRIAAANSVSDVYSMGGRPLLALNLVGWNRDELSMDLLGEVLAGAAEVAAEGGFVVAGGHTVDDPEPKFGMAVVGEAHPDRLLTNAGLRPGQLVILTKPLGMGIISTAVKSGVCPEPLAAASVAEMTRLNDVASAVALDAGATGATDVTGFGLLGHLGRAALESGVDVVIDTESVPILDGVRALARAGVVPGGSNRNLESVLDRLSGRGIDEANPSSPRLLTDDQTPLLLADAQTSGGLVFGVDPDRAERALARLIDTGHTAAIVGELAPGRGQIILE